ncbi:MAG TPA: SDR family oxidoreductase [Bacteroidota bacterium]|nr:SDR family oxidoreductase [Bacteroidota bacterium]
MTTLKNLIVLITGASSGIGLACARKFAEAGARPILIARRRERLEKLAAELKSKHNTQSLIIPLDVRDRKAVQEKLERLPDGWGEVDVLLNNAGLSRGLDKLHEGKFDDWDEMIDTNIKGLLYVSRMILPGMVKRNRGTIINLGSIAGHEVYPGGNVYCATKFAVDALTRSLRLELVDTQVRVCTVDPGLVETEFSMVRYRGDVERAKKVYTGIQPLAPEDVADAVLFCATRPPHVQIAEIIMLATNQASTMVIHRKS